MQPQTQTTTLTTVFSEVLGNLAFMFADPDPADISPGASWEETTISYSGPQSGTLKLQCTRDFGILLASNLLGIDAQDSDAEARAIDAVKEFMNVVCGHFVTEMHGTEHVFDLTIPQSRHLAETPQFVGADDPLASSLCVEGHRVQLIYCPKQGTGNSQA